MSDPGSSRYSVKVTTDRTIGIRFPVETSSFFDTHASCPEFVLASGFDVFRRLPQSLLTNAKMAP